MVTDRLEIARAPRARTTQLSREAIAERAYEHFVRRGRQDGHDVEDWLAAELELLTEQAATATTRTTFKR